MNDSLAECFFEFDSHCIKYDTDKKHPRNVPVLCRFRCRKSICLHCDHSYARPSRSVDNFQGTVRCRYIPSSPAICFQRPRRTQILGSDRCACQHNRPKLCYALRCKKQQDFYVVEMRYIRVGLGRFKTFSCI